MCWSPTGIYLVYSNRRIPRIPPSAYTTCTPSAYTSTYTFTGVYSIYLHAYLHRRIPRIPPFITPQAYITYTSVYVHTYVYSVRWHAVLSPSLNLRSVLSKLTSKSKSNSSPQQFSLKICPVVRTQSVVNLSQGLSQ